MSLFKNAAACMTAAAIGVSLVGCSNAERSAVGAWGSPALVEKFSGGKLVFIGISEGKIMNEAQSDGYYFADKCQDGRLTEVSGDVVILRPDPMPSVSQVLDLRKKLDVPQLGFGN